MYLSVKEMVEIQLMIYKSVLSSQEKHKTVITSLKN